MQSAALLKFERESCQEGMNFNIKDSGTFALFFPQTSVEVRGEEPCGSQLRLVFARLSR